MLNKRVLSAAILIPIVVAVVWWGGYPLAIGLALVAVLSTNEILDMAGHLGAQPVKAVILPAAAILVADGVWPEAGILRWVVLALPLVLLAMEVWHDNRPGSVLSWAIGVAAPLYIGYVLSYFFRLRAIDGGLWWLGTALVGTWISDSAAYFVGVRWGKRRLAPVISPKKSWEGLGGELLGALLCMVPAGLFLLHIPWWGGVLLAVLLTALATLGDLAESVLKRQAGIKDSSHLIPGHGGMLDRIDSLLFVVPAFYLVHLLLSVL